MKSIFHTNKTMTRQQFKHSNLSVAYYNIIFKTCNVIFKQVLDNTLNSCDVTFTTDQYTLADLEIVMI